MNKFFQRLLSCVSVSHLLVLAFAFTLVFHSSHNNCVRGFLVVQVSPRPSLYYHPTNTAYTHTYTYTDSTFQQVYPKVHYHPTIQLSQSNSNSNSNEHETNSTTTTHNIPVVKGITLKMAFDQNYAIGDANPLPNTQPRFTSPPSLDLVHLLRRNVDAVLVGKETVLQDDCSLTVRRVPLLLQKGDNEKKGGVQPTRVILDSKLQLLEHSTGDDDDDGRHQFAILNDGYNTIIYYAKEYFSSCNQRQLLLQEYIHSLSSSPNIQLIPISTITSSSSSTDTNSSSSSSSSNILLSPMEIIQDLNTNRGIQHIMIEGGAKVATSFLSHQLIDRAIIIKANESIVFQQPIESKMSKSTFETVGGLVLLGERKCGDDVVEYWSRRGVDKDNDDDDDDVLEWPSGNNYLEGWPC